jgi:hypothetical protein
MVRHAFVTQLVVGAAAAFVLSFSVSTMRQPETVSPRQAQPDPKGYLIQPSEWVPISYETEFELNGVKSGSRFLTYRNRAGSTRSVAMTQGIETNRIDNVVLGKHYLWRTGGVGSVHPLRSRPNNNKPFLTIGRSRLQEVAQSDPRVQHLSTAANNLTFWQFVNSVGDTIVYCPELNLLDVHVNMRNGKVKRVVNVLLGEPAPDLFLPPSDVEFKAESDSRGAGAIDAPPSQKKGAR